MTVTVSGWDRGLIPQSIVIEFFGKDDKYIVWGVALHDEEFPFWLDSRLTEESEVKEVSYERYKTFAEILTRVLELTGFTAEEYGQQCAYKEHKLYNGLLEMANGI